MPSLAEIKGKGTAPSSGGLTLAQIKGKSVAPSTSAEQQQPNYSAMDYAKDAVNGIAYGGSTFLRGIGNLAASAANNTLGRLENLATGKGNQATQYKLPQVGPFSDQAYQSIAPKTWLGTDTNLATQAGISMAPSSIVSKATQALPWLTRVVARTLPDAAMSMVQNSGAGATAEQNATNTGITALASAVGNSLLPAKPVGIVSNLLRTAAPGYVADVSAGLAGQRGEDRTGGAAFIPGIGTALSAGIGSYIAGRQITSKVSRTNKAAEIMNTVARVNPSDARKFQQTTGEDVGNYLVNRGIYGNDEEIMQKMYAESQRSRELADAELAKMGGRWKSSPIKTALDELKGRETRISTPGAPSRDLAFVSEMQRKFDEGGLTMTEINQIKRLYERNVKLDYLRQNLSESVARANTLDDAIRKWQFKQAKLNGLENLPEINKNTQASRMLADALWKKLGGQKGNNLFSLTDAVLMSGGDIHSLGMVGARKIFGNNSVKSRVAQAIAPKPNMAPVTAETRAPISDPSRLLVSPTVQNPIVNQGRPIPVMPISPDKMDYVGGETVATPRSKTTTTPQAQYKQSQSSLPISEPQPQPKATDLSTGSEKVAGSFSKSTDQKPVGKFVIGSFGNNSFSRKAGQKDRFPVSELENTQKYIARAYNASADSSNYRSGNVAWVADMPNGEQRVIYTRQNASGNEEIINAHTISSTKYEDKLKSFGVPAESRTRIFSLEGKRSDPLTYKDNFTVAQSKSESKNLSTGAHQGGSLPNGTPKRVHSEGERGMANPRAMFNDTKNALGKLIRNKNDANAIVDRLTPDQFRLARRVADTNIKNRGADPTAWTKDHKDLNTLLQRMGYAIPPTEKEYNALVRYVVDSGEKAGYYKQLYVD